MNYNCKHFTRDWVESFGRDGNSIKGLAGENRLYHALCMIAREEHLEDPKQLGEPDPVSTAILARTSGYPDCYLRVDDREYLFEARNVCYYHADWNRSQTGWKRKQLFYQEPLDWVKAKTTSPARKWLEDRYPIRGTQRRKGHTWEYGQWIYLHNKQNARKFYVSTVPSFNENARTELDRFFGKNEVFTDHAILSVEMCRDAEDYECAMETMERLVLRLKSVII